MVFLRNMEEGPFIFKEPERSRVTLFRGCAGGGGRNAVYASSCTQVATNVGDVTKNQNVYSRSLSTSYYNFLIYIGLM